MLSITGARILTPGGSAIFGGAIGALPLASTNGADGVFPTFFDTSVADGSLAGWQSLKKVLDSGGDWYMPVILDSGFGSTGAECRMTYTHSTARAS